MQQEKILVESGTNELELLVFLLENQTYALNVAKVQTIFEFDSQTITKIPQSHSAIMGVFSYDDHATSIIDLRSFLHMPAAQHRSQTIIVTEFNNRRSGFCVDSVEGIHRINWKEFIPIGKMLGHYDGSVIGFVDIDGTHVMVLDMENILAEIFPSITFDTIERDTLEKAESMKRREVQIFFAEDSRLIRETVAEILKMAGYEQIRLFENGQQAYDILSGITSDEGPEGPNLPRVLISDIEMPQMDGLTLCRKARVDLGLKEMAVIIFSSLINEQMVDKCMRVGATDTVAKPDSNRLLALLDGVCGIS